MTDIITPLKDSKQRPKYHKVIFHEPNTVDLWNGKDNEENSKPWVGGRGRDIFTSHLTQTGEQFEKISYAWNSLGLRGPEPNYSANKKIIFGGGSLSLGCGVKLEDSFPFIVAKKFNASYLNFSPADCFTDLIDILIEYKSFSPDYIVLSDTRFIQSYGWGLREIYKIRRLEEEKGYRKYFTRADIDCLKMFDYFLKGLFPNTKLILAYCERRAWKSIVPELNNIQKIAFEAKETVVDLARDGFHPGVKSHAIMADKIIKGINNV